MPNPNINLDGELLYRCDMQVRVSDLNYGNHLSNDKILSYFHEIRVLWLASHHLSEKDVGGCGLIMTGASVKYLQQAFLHQSLDLSMAVKDIGKARFTLMYELKEANSNQVIAFGETLMGCFDYVRQKPSKAPQKLLNILTNR